MPEDSRIARRKKDPKENDSSNLGAYLAIAGIIAIVGVVAFVFLQGGSSDTTVSANLTTGGGPDPSMVSASNPSGEDALTVYYYGDFQCPHCKTFEQEYFPRLRENYVETGKVRFVFRPLTFLGRNSYRAGLSAYCVWNDSPGAYWNYHSKLFSEQSTGDWASVDALVRYAGEVEGVDGSELRSCVESEEFADALSQNSRQAKSAGVSSTPTLVIDGETVNGNNYQRVQALIERKLGGGSPN